MGNATDALDDGNMDDINNNDHEETPEDEHADQAELGDGDTLPDDEDTILDSAEDAADDSAEDSTLDSAEDAADESPSTFSVGEPLDDDVLADATASVEDKTIEDTPLADQTIDDEPASAYVPPTPPPTPQAVPQYDRLTRDPTATFGGVLSGIAHRYGWDVSLTRLAFVVLLIVSGGTAIVAYLLSWVIIPRATHWPPVRVATTRSRLSARDLGIGLIGLGALVILGIGSGQAAAVLVPLALVGGGIWLLMQNPREDATAVPAGAPVSATPYSAMTTQPTAAPAAATQADFVMPQTPPQPYATVIPQEVPKRSRARRVGLIGLFGFLGLILLALVAIPVLLLALVFGGDIDVDAEYVFRPATIDAIPSYISEDAGEIRLDLREVDFSSIERDADPVEVEVDLDLGRIEVLLPEDVRVDIDADTDLGDVTVLGSNDDGINPSRSFRDDDPQLELDLDLNVGEIVVARGNTSTVTTIEVN